MTVAVTKNTGMVPVTSTGKGYFDDQQVAILKSSYAKSLDNIEFKVFLETAAALKLNPFSREIYAIKYGGTMSLVTSIDGYRKLSARSGRFMGVTNGRLRVKTREGESITIDHEFYDPDEHTIISGTIGIRVKDWPDPVEATAVFKTYKKDQANWKLMPDVMILKCAEAQAHRKAALLPDLGVFANVAPIYVDDEIQDYNIVDIKPEPAKHAELPKPEPKPRKSIVEPPAPPVKTQPSPEELPPLEPEVVAEIKTILEPTPVEALLEKVWGTYREWGCSEEGIIYAENRISDKFGVDDFNEITSVDELRKYCAGELKKELEAESFLPLRVKKDE